MRTLSRAIIRGPVFAAVLAFSVAAGAAFEVPELTGPVVDDAGLLSRTAEASLESALRRLKDSGGSQLQVLTVPSLGGVSIEDASIRVAEKWRLGTEKDDRGVLLLIARDDREARIEVGQGNEGDLTDAQAKRIIEDSMMPLFRAGDFDSGVIVGVYQIARATDPSIDIKPLLEGSIRRPAPSPPRLPVNAWVVLAILIWFVLTQFMGGGGGRGLRRRSGVHYGGWGGGRGGWPSGGGWKGGGGGFSGGGASGRW